MFKHNRGYTLVEMLMATVLTLMMMSAVVGLFESVGRGISNSRALLDTNDRLRMAALQLQRDLGGVTVTMLPPRRPEDNEGYFEYLEGPIGPVFRPEALARDFDKPRTATTADPIPYESDTTVADNDDILLFTTRTSADPFVGRCVVNGTLTTIQSTTAEVAWFLRGRTLYRRILLVAPNRVAACDSNGDGVVNRQDSALQNPSGGYYSYYARFDVSARPETYVDNATYKTGWVGNTLGDLTKRENRFAHRAHATADAFPYSAGRWGQMGLPLLCETAATTWMASSSLPTLPMVTYTCPIDFWRQPHPWVDGSSNPLVDVTTGALLAQTNPNFVGDDVVLTNVIGFDVKAWDPGAPTILNTTGTAPVVLVPGDPGYIYALIQAINAVSGYAIASYGAYVDLNYMCQLGTTTYTPTANAPLPLFDGAGHSYSGINGVGRYNKANRNNPFDTSDLIDSSTPPTIQATLRSYSVYDTWSTHYENDGVQQYGTAADTGTNGLDDNGDGVVDDLGEADTRPPYPVPLRGIQVTIRVYEPSTRQVRQRTIQQDFLAR